MTCKNLHMPIVIPAYEPDDRLIPLLQSLTEAGLTNIVLVDDGGGADYQHYFDRARLEYGCQVLVHERNMGKGRALKDGFAYCRKTDPDLVGCVTADSDGQHRTQDIMRCMQALEENPGHLILGCRDFSGSNVPGKSRFGNNTTKRVMRYVCGIRVSDTQTGLRAIPAAFMEELQDTKGERFEFETNMLIDSKKKYPITEISIETVYDSAENHQTHFRPFVDSLKIYSIFLKRFGSFLMSSLSASAIDLVTFTLLCLLLEPRFGTVAATVVSNVVARILSATYNYLINYVVVFKSKENRLATLGRYALLAVIQMGCSTGLVTLFVWILQGLLPKTVVKIIVDCVLFLVSFVLQRELVFKA